MLLYLPQVFLFIWQTKMSLLVAIAPNPILCSPLFPNRCATSDRDYRVPAYFDHTKMSALGQQVRHSSHTSSEPPSEGRAFLAAITGERGTSKCSWWKREGEKDGEQVQDSISEGKIRFYRFRIKVVPNSYFILASATNSVHDWTNCW